MKKASLLWCFSFVLLACSHISAKRNLEKITEMQLPDGYIVLLNEYRRTGADSFYQYNVQFDKDSTWKLVQQIQSSKYYSDEHVQALYDSIWYVENELYKFEARSESTDRKYQIVFNPATGVLEYQEYRESDKL